VTLRIVPVAADTADLWRDIHNAVVPAHALSREEVQDRLTRNLLSLAYDGTELVGNATIGPPRPESMIATVMVRIRPEYRRQGRGAEYLAAMLAQARSLSPRRIQTVVLASNEDGLTFAARHGFVESGRYTPGRAQDTYVELYLARVLGVDGCRDGWVGVALEDDVAGTYFAASIDDLVSMADAGGRVATVAIDIPIGLPDDGCRRADVLARAELGTRWPSIFMTPVRQALLADDYATASAANRALTGHGISRQAFGLRKKILQVDGWVRGSPAPVVVETHPELCFARLAGAPLTVRKSTWEGARLRRGLLAGAGITVPADIGAAGAHASVDDVLDAAAAAWAARQVLAGTATAFPDPPETFSDGWSCAIWA
jgi:predicted RNase H-like nuclease/GNAT superfamily N-acetyltransferase